MRPVLALSKRLADRALRGEKTQHRREARGSRPPFRRGGRYPLVVDGREVEGAAVEVVGVRQEMLADLSYEDARAEGFKTRGQFAEYWIRRHRPGWTRDLNLSDEQWLERLLGNYGSKPVWVIEFRVVEAPRFLHKDASRGYTSDRGVALRDEPEAVDADSLRKIVREAYEGWKGLQTANEAQRLHKPMTPEDRLRELREMARERGVDLSDDEFVIRKRLDAMERKVRRFAA